METLKEMEARGTEGAALSDFEVLKVTDPATGEVFYGCDQRWFATEWQRTAGCGPSVAATILLYLESRSAGRAETPAPRGRELCAARMEEVWRYVTPTVHGIPSTEMFLGAVRAYGEAKGLRLACGVFDVPRGEGSRPSFAELSGFLDAALSRDVPVAFLNLCNGSERNLDRWHWVAVVSREGSLVHILDEGIVKIVDLAQWLETTKEGGGLVWFETE